jgi:hypothetical protein
MSGPKVVRIVTRDEIEAICRQHIAAVQEAADALERLAKRVEHHDAKLTTKLQRTCAEFGKLFTEERWTDIQKAAPMAVASINADTDRLRRDAVADAARRHDRGKRTADAARALVVALEAAGRPVDAELVTASNSAPQTADDVTKAEAAITRGLLQIKQSTEGATVVPGDEALAARLGTEEQGSTLQAWIEASMTKRDERERRLDDIIPELEVRAGPEMARSFAERAGKVASESDASRRALLTDSLILEGGRVLKERRIVDESLAAMRDARAALAGSVSDAGRGMHGRLSEAINAANVSGAETLCAEAKALGVAEAGKSAALARRRAILQGLASLGYEIGETMTTAWEKDGRIIVRKPGSSDYGIEIGAPADVVRMQVRLVGPDRPASPRTADRDKDQETIWCADFDRLKHRLASDGCDLHVERVVAAGKQAVKSVVLPSEDTQQAGGVRKPQARSL